MEEKDILFLMAGGFVHQSQAMPGGVCEDQGMAGVMEQKSGQQVPHNLPACKPTIWGKKLQNRALSLLDSNDGMHIYRLVYQSQFEEG